MPEPENNRVELLQGTALRDEVFDGIPKWQGQNPW
jgi:hypothetical protein